MKANEKLIEATIDFLEKRFDKSEEDVVVAGAYTEKGDVLFGVATDAFLNAACLCAETGPICEAQKLNLRLTAIVCIMREKPDSQYIFLTPCGLCQERLLYFGKSLTVVVPETDPTKWTVKKLGELHIHHWYNGLKTGT